MLQGTSTPDDKSGKENILCQTANKSNLFMSKVLWMMTTSFFFFLFKSACSSDLVIDERKMSKNADDSLHVTGCSMQKV